VVLVEYYQRIRNVREDKDILQYELADLIGIKSKTYNLYENGLRSIPFPVLSKVLDELDLSLDYVLGLSEKRTYPNLKEIHVDILQKNLRTYRKKMRLSQMEMSNLLNCSQQALSEYERGNLAIPLLTLKTFCQITRISADTIAGRTNTLRTLEKVHN